MDSLIKSLRPTYAQINLNNLEHNIAIARKMSNSDIIAIVKADGYGHGAKEISHHAYEKCNVRNFGVATISEGFSLRSSFKNNGSRIIVLGYVDKVFYKDVLDNKLILTIFDYNIADNFHEYLVKSDKTAPVVLKIDTGMGRLGFDVNLDLNEFGKKYPRFNIVHLMSHLSSSDDDEEYTSYQIKQFDNFLGKYPDRTFDTSLFNSSAIANYKNKYTLTRPGLFLYGYVHSNLKPDLKPVMSIRSKIVHIQKLTKGKSVSYNRQFRAEKDCLVAVVPVGYADGYSRALTNKGFMLVNNVKCPVVGRVCMDMTMIDISDIGEKAYGMDVEILGDNITAVDIANLTGTVDYEVLCSISDRIPRIYEPESGG